MDWTVGVRSGQAGAERLVVDRRGLAGLGLSGKARTINKKEKCT